MDHHALLLQLSHLPVSIPKLPHPPSVLPPSSRPFLPPARVSVKPLKGSPFKTEVDALDTIHQLKSKLQALLANGTLPQQMRLLLGGKTLSDTRTLLDYGVGDSCLVTLAIIGSAPETTTIVPAVHQLSAEEKQSLPETSLLDDDIFWAKIKTLLDGRFSSDQSSALLQEWKNSASQFMK
ncbi:hypothetical protein HDU91_001532 [Kappamyces sp. JEL0680]|nr:hypothetical protein HDU91_001532 [Kappamyces sp. JEL0680]